MKTAKQNPTKDDYFAAAKKAAMARIADTSAAHSAATAVLRAMEPNRSEEFYGDMGWQCVLSAKWDSQ